MRQINDKIRNNIANSYYLRTLAKDDKLTKEEQYNIYKYVEELDKKIIFYKLLNNALKETKDEKHR